MRNDEAVLDDIIKDGSIDVDGWPELLKRLLQRLDHIAHNSFPAAKISLVSDDIDIVSVAPSQSQTIPSLSTQQTQLTESQATQESSVGISSPPSFSQDEPSSPKMLPPPVVPAFPSPPPPPIPKETTPPPGTLDPEDHSLLTSLTTTLTTQFENAPPYTVQRLAELLRHPNAHYRSLSKYLRALQRVLSVSSSTTAFPLPPSIVDSMPNGAAPFNLGSDESLGGALLSPIPWLTPSPLTHGAPGELGSGANGVSQGELLRQEQEHNIPAPQIVGGEGAVHIHAEGPPALGPEDVGPQPEGTVFPDPPATLEEARSPRPAARIENEEEMGDAFGAPKEGSQGEKEKEKEEQEREQEPAKDGMDVDTKGETEPSGEQGQGTASEGKGNSSEVMQLDGATDASVELPQEKMGHDDDGTIS